MTACRAFLTSPNPRITSCARCGRSRDAHTHERKRNPALERYLTDLAAQAAGLTDDRGLRAFADHRAHPGGIRPGRDWDIEIAEEIADGAGNYAIWALEEDYVGYMAGEPDATARFERRLRTLVRLMQAWHELHTEAH